MCRIIAACVQLPLARRGRNSCDDEINDIYILTQIVHCEKYLYIYLLKIEWVPVICIHR